ncbi:class I SAM-dependent methyltransferase [Utexia brackfieldae]|uniref:class I SAM-dependent methyltransferase n=1 Tax=Utexia brackfieldae TaxID=3074108 RepID=UPI00370D7527
MIQLICEAQADPAKLAELAGRFGLVHDALSCLALVLTDRHLALRKLDEPKLGDVVVDFTDGAMAHRRRFGGGRGEAVAKAVGIKGNYLPTVIDATAGLGRDAFVLAALGCHVTLFERHPVVAALLEDGLKRAYQDQDIGQWMQTRMILVHASSIEALPEQVKRPDVVYLDPMFPHRQKSALVKKEMRIFQSLVGSDEDADALLDVACQLAIKRVAVKRPDYAPFLAQKKPQAEIKTKSHRFDLYAGRGAEA